MSELPQGWAVTALKKIAAWGSGGTPSRSEPCYYGGDIPWIKTGELGPRTVNFSEETITEAGLANSSAKLFPAGSVAIAMYGATIGKTSILGIPATTNQACAVGIPHLEITSKEYLYHFLCSQKDAFIEAGKGGAQPNISQGVIKDWEIPLAPLPEQKRIADKLDSTLARVDACRDRLDRLPALLKRFRQSILAAATSGRLTEDWRTTRSLDEAQRNPGTAAPDSGADAPVSGLLGWHITSLGKVATDFSYGSAAKSSKAGRVPVLRMGNIQDGDLDWDDLVFTSDQHEIDKYRLAHGDVLFNRTNSPELVGKTAVFKGAREAIYAGYLIRVRCSHQLLPDYLNYCLGSPAGRDYCWQVKSDGVSQSNINAKKLAAFEFMLPPLAEQQEIVRRVEILFAFADRLEARLATARKQAGQLTPALLAKAFRGELVPQDPNDEPATELLKRLAAAKSEAAPRPRKTTKPRNARSSANDFLD